MQGKNLQKYLEREAKQDSSLETRLRRLKVYFDVALRIADKRKKLGLTQSALAERLSTTQPNIARWETPGYDRYSLSRLIDIAEALDVILDIRFLERVSFTEDLKWPDGAAMLRGIRSHDSIGDMTTGRSTAVSFIGYKEALDD